MQTTASSKDRALLSVNTILKIIPSITKRCFCITLSAQVDSSITPDKFWQAAMETGRTIILQNHGNNLKFGPILDPVALIEKLGK